jgi:YbbR domain-containing protein
MMFIRNIPLKVASLFIAVVLAYGVHSARNSSVVSLFVPLEVKNTPEDRVIVKPVKRGAQVTLRGPSFVVGPLASAPPSLRVKLPDDSEDRVTVSLRAADLSLPPSIEVLSIEPSQMEFILEPIERQELQVTVPRVGQLAKELVLEGLEVLPKTVSVKGPRSELKGLKVIETEPVDLASLDRSTELALNLRTPGGSVVPSVKSVVVRLAVGEQPTQRSFLQVPVEVHTQSGAGAVSVVPSVVSLSVSGSPSALANIKIEELSPFIRINSAIELSGEVKRPVQIQLPLGLRATVIEPSSVSIKPLISPKRGENLPNKVSVKKR